MLPESTGSQLKSFWSRPEGKTGIIVLVLLAGLGIWGWGSIVGFLVSMMVDTLHLVGLVAALAAILWVLLSKRSHLIFRLLMRALTSVVINIDPIGVLKDRLRQMRQRRDKLEEQISQVSGQIGRLKDVIAQNSADAEKKMRMAAQADKMASAAHDSLEAQRMTFQKTAKARQAGRLQNANITYQQLLNKIQMVYDLLSKWAVHIDFFIEDTQDEVKQEEIKYKTVNAAYRAYKTAVSMIRGNADETELYNETMERLAENASRKLGEIDDFQRVAQGFMDSIDIQNGAVEEQALAKLDQYEQKLLTSGNQDTAFLLPGAMATPQAIPIDRQKAPAATGTTDSYGKFFK
jgi:hypothetical protein